MAVLFAETFTGTNGSSPSSEWTVGGDSGSSAQIQGNRLRLTTPSGNNYGAAYANTVDTYTDVDFTADYVFHPSGTGNAVAEIAWRKTASEGGYFIEINKTSMLVYGYDDLPSYTFGQIGSTLTHGYAAGDTMHVRVQHYGSTVRVRHWKNGDPEPSTWWVEAADGGWKATAGSVGLVTYNGDNTTSTYGEFDNVEISTIPFPYPVGTAASTIGTSMGDPRSITLPSGVQTGELLISQVACDAAVTLTTSSSGWVKLDGYNNAAVSGAVFAKVATGSDALSVAGGTTQDYAALTYRVAGHGVSTPATDLAFAGAGFSTANTSPDPPNCNPGTAKEYLWLVGFVADDDDNATTYAPSGFTGLGQAESAQSTSSCMTSAAHAQSNASSRDPGVFTLAAAEEWWAWTIAVPPAPSGTTYPQTVTAAATTTATVQRSAGKVVAAAAAATETVVRDAVKVIARTATGAPAFTRDTARTVAASVTTAVALAAAKMLLRTLDVAASGAVSIARAAVKTVTVPASSTATVARHVAKTIARTATGAPTVVRQSAKSLTVTAASAATVLRQAALSVGASSAGAASMLRDAARTVTVLPSTAVSFARSAAKTLPVTATATATAVRAAQVTLTAGSAATAAAQRAVGKVLSAASSAVSSLASEVITGVETFYATLDVAASGAVSIARDTAKTVAASVSSAATSTATHVAVIVLDVAASAIATVTRATSATLTAATTATATAAKAVVVSVVAVASAGAAVTRSVVKTLAAAATATTAVVAALVEIVVGAAQFAASRLRRRFNARSVARRVDDTDTRRRFGNRPTRRHP